MFDIDGEK